jgi:hypothetical protein
MYVSAFWFGVLATLAAEFLIAAVHAVASDHREAKEDASKTEQDSD